MSRTSRLPPPAETHALSPEPGLAADAAPARPSAKASEAPRPFDQPTRDKLAKGRLADRRPRRPARHDAGRGPWPAVRLPAPRPCRRAALCAGDHRQGLVARAAKACCGAPCPPGCRRRRSGRWSAAMTMQRASMAARARSMCGCGGRPPGPRGMTPFGEKMRALRRAARRARRRQMAAALGVSAAYLSALEHGRRGVPSWPMVQKIIGYFNVIWDEAEELAAAGADVGSARRHRHVRPVAGSHRARQPAGREHRPPRQRRLERLRQQLAEAMTKSPERPS